MLVIDSAIYLILTWYIEEVYPGTYRVSMVYMHFISILLFSGKYGVSRPFYFFIQPTYWFGQRASTWFDFTMSRRSTANYTLVSQQSDEEAGLSQLSDSDFSEDTGTHSTESIHCMCDY